MDAQGEARSSSRRASWHWIFLVNVPLGVVAFVLALRLIESPAEPAPAPLDRVGCCSPAPGSPFVFVGNVGIKPATTMIYSRFGFRTVRRDPLAAGARAGFQVHSLA